MTPMFLITRREFRANLLKKSSLLTMIISVILVVGGIFVADYFINRDSDESATQVAVVEEATFLESLTADSPAADQLPEVIEVVNASTDDQARSLVEEGEVSAALLSDQDGQWTLVESGAPSATIAPMIQQALVSAMQSEALAEQGVDPALMDQVAAGALLNQESLEEENMFAVVVTIFAAALLMMAVMMFGGAVAYSVIEEKSSRVVEIILATARPLDLLIGKILGAGAAGLIMFTVVISAGAGAFSFTSLSDGVEIPWSALALTVPFFLFGYLFFAALYAAAASLVSRMEDFNAVQMPVLIIAFATFYVPIFGWSALDSTFMTAAGWIPPVSIATAPMQVAAGNMSVGQSMIALALLAIASALVVWLASVIYPRNVLRTGKPVSWKEAFKR